jgi:riboflavin kinase/FMN adenylyltransferase
MILQRGFETPAAYRGGFVSIGNFDGVHRGHQKIAAVLVDRARQAGVPAVVLTFDPHPISLLRPGQSPPGLSTVERKAELLGKCDVDCVIAYRTDANLLSLSPVQFFEQIIKGELNARGLVEGPNFFFGHDRSGDITTLRHLCESAKISLEIVHSMMVSDQMISSSLIRARISEGDIASAVEWLGHPYQIEGRVGTGAMRGRDVGFPTANLEGMTILLPPDGVYAGTVTVEGKVHPAAVHLGPNPTFGEQNRKLEVHVVDYDGDLYCKTLAVDLLDRVRGVVRFSGVDELRRQLKNDIEKVRTIAAGFESKN